MVNKINKEQQRFFFHYNKVAKRMTVHWQNQCLLTDELEVRVPVETKQNKRQPRIVLRGWANRIEMKDLPGNRQKIEVY